MNESRAPGSILISSVGEQSCRSIAGMIDRSLYTSLVFAKTGSETRRLLPGRRFRLVIINAPLSDEFGHELAADIARQYTCGVILLVKSDVYEEVTDLVLENGVITVPKPLSRQLFYQAVRLGLSVESRLSSREQEISRLKRKLDEARLIGRVKCILVEKRKLTEEEAHHFLEKEAMNHRTSLREEAEEILRMYE